MGRLAVVVGAMAVLFWIAVGVVFAAILFFILSLYPLTPAHAHMHDRPDLDAWLKQLYSVARGPCCDNSEAETMADPDWRNASELKKGECDAGSNLGAETKGLLETVYCVKLETPETHEWHWWAVPHAAVVELPNRAGPALIWMVWVAADGGNVGPRRVPYIRCFLPGSGV
jgi:hypothetical protein